MTPGCVSVKLDSVLAVVVDTQNVLSLRSLLQTPGAQAVLLPYRSPYTSLCACGLL